MIEIITIIPPIEISFGEEKERLQTLRSNEDAKEIQKPTYMTMVVRESSKYPGIRHISYDDFHAILKQAEQAEQSEYHRLERRTEPRK